MSIDPAAHRAGPPPYPVQWGLPPTPEPPRRRFSWQRVGPVPTALLLTGLFAFVAAAAVPFISSEYPSHCNVALGTDVQVRSEANRLVVTASRNADSVKLSRRDDAVVLTINGSDCIFRSGPQAGGRPTFLGLDGTPFDSMRVSLREGDDRFEATGHAPVDVLREVAVYGGPGNDALHLDSITRGSTFVEGGPGADGMSPGTDAARGVLHTVNAVEAAPTDGSSAAADARDVVTGTGRRNALVFANGQDRVS